MEHTPGPWFWKKHGSLGNDHFNVLWGAVDINHTPYIGVNEDDAYLISAAPDLLFAAEQALMALEEGYYAPKIRDDLRSAIAKAKGE